MSKEKELVFTDEASRIINEEFSDRKSRNKGYSLRAFARDLDTSPATMTRILNGKTPSASSYFKILDNIKIKPVTRDYLHSLYMKNSGESSEYDEKQYLYWKKFGAPVSLTGEQFSKINNLNCINLLCFFSYNDKINYKEIHEILEIEKEDAEIAIEKLAEIGLIEIIGENEVIPSPIESLTTEDCLGEVTNLYVQEVFKKGIERLQLPDLHKTNDYIDCYSFAIADSKIDEARKYLKSMLNEFAEKFPSQLQEIQKDESYSTAVLGVTFNLLSKK